MFINIDAIEEHYKISSEDLQTKTLMQIRKLETDMNIERMTIKADMNKGDIEYQRIIKKYFTPFAYLAQFWSEQEIMTACCDCHLDKSDVVSEEIREIELSDEFLIENNYEYIGRKNKLMPMYSYGRELVSKKVIKGCYNYRIRGGRQHIDHGGIILKLLYQKYPILEQYEFKAYTYILETSSYDIYPNNHIMTPLNDIMTGDINHIMKINTDYAAKYNNGFFSPKNMAKKSNQNKYKNISKPFKIYQDKHSL